MADINLIPVESPELPVDPNAGNFNIGGTGSFGGLVISGVSTLGVTTSTDLTSQTLNVSGISILGVTSISQLYVSGITTLGVTTITDLTSQTLNVSGISTLGITSATNFTSQTLNVSGITTLGVTTITDITSQSLNVSGISTLGIASVTNFISQTLNVSGISSFTDGPLLVTNGSVGIATTNPTSKLHIIGDTLITGITTTNNLTVNSIKCGCSTSLYSGLVGITTINSDLEEIHFITFDTSTSEFHISNFVTGRKCTIIARNTNAGGSRILNIKTSGTTIGHVSVPILVSEGTNTVTTGNVTIPASRGVKIEVFNINTTIVGHYG